jgi:hypothetical protein
VASVPSNPSQLEHHPVPTGAMRERIRTTSGTSVETTADGKLGGSTALTRCDVVCQQPNTNLPALIHHRGGHITKSDRSGLPDMGGGNGAQALLPLA